MTKLLSVALGFFLCCSAVAAGQTEALPQSVGDAYLAYEAAMASNDRAAATVAAETAWREAQSARIDPALIGVLAANYGDLAEARADHVAASAARLEAAEIADRLGDAVQQRFVLWHRAASSAYLQGDYPEASRRSVRAEQLLIEGGIAGVSQALLADHYVLAAQAGMLARRPRLAADMADQAIDFVRARDGISSANYATMMFLSGIGATLQRDWVRCSIQLRQAGAAFALLDREPDRLIADALQSMCVGYVDVDERWEMISLIQSSDHPDPDFDYVDERSGEVGWLRRQAPQVDLAWAQQYLTGAITLDFAVNRRGEATDIRVAANTLDEAIIPVVTEALEGFWFEPNPTGLERNAVRFDFQSGRFVDPTESGFRPIVIVQSEPRYPYAAARSGDVGVVVVRYSVDDAGRIHTPELIYEMPAGVFGEAVLEALSDWRYAPLDPQMPAEDREGIVSFFHFRLRG